MSTSVKTILTQSNFSYNFTNKEDEKNSPSSLGNSSSSHSTETFDSTDYHAATTVKDMYGEGDLSSCPLFKGGYINFGYWENIDLSVDITENNRILSSENLYRRVFQSLEFKPSDTALEIGSGLGYGCVLSLTDYKIAKSVGVDFSEEQIMRAKSIQDTYHQNLNNLQFIQSRAEELPFNENTFSKVYSLEAAQHFSEINKFIAESYRVLQKDGKFVVSTFFATSSESIDKLKELIPTIESGVDKAIPVENIRSQMEAVGFKNVSIQNIGEKVWYGFDKWIHQCQMGDTWNKNWITSYKDKLVDYYLIEGIK